MANNSLGIVKLENPGLAFPFSGADYAKSLFSDDPAVPYCDQVFIDCCEWDSVDDVIGICNDIRSYLDTNHIERYEPIIISVAGVPAEHLNDIVAYFCRHDIPTISLTFTRYVEIVNDVERGSGKQE